MILSLTQDLLPPPGSKTARRTDESEVEPVRHTAKPSQNSRPKPGTELSRDHRHAAEATHVGITLGLGASAHQPGWSLWLM